jgi:hypothetical protein
MKKILLVTLVAWSASAFAGNFLSNAGVMQQGIDEANAAQQRNQCFNSCPPNDSACQRSCLAGSERPVAATQVDAMCANDCMRRGYLYDYCIKRCSF